MNEKTFVKYAMLITRGVAGSYCTTPTNRSIINFAEVCKLSWTDCWGKRTNHYIIPNHITPKMRQ